MSALKDVLAYRNDSLVIAFAKKHRQTIQISEDLFLELKRWMWLIGSRDEDAEPFPSFPEQWILDDYWHEFILSTRAYTDFCMLFFGRYIHHTPTPHGVNDANESLAAEDMQRFLKVSRQTLRNTVLEVRQKLGDEVAVRWYVDLPQRYPLSKAGAPCQVEGSIL
ncbi:TPA: hypothetical protein NII08_002263 [Pseudomonas aeruginosa]|uniref:glycine-rich domain-containing protein n=1 Tax=Pseudomonas aeruginosa TaxID=287 RepID=UPI003A4D331B|nr:hypothetical protein [Pseudomonas aeruginosa]